MDDSTKTREQLIEELEVARSTIAEQKQVEDALQESEKRYRSLFEQAGDYILVLEPRPDGPPIIVDANQAALNFHGFTRDELVGKPISMLDGEKTSKFDLKLKKQLMSGEHVLLKTAHKRKDGSVFPVEASIKMFKTEGRPPLIISIERDITERKRASAKLIDASSLNQLILDTTPVGVFIFKETGPCILANPSSATISGATVEELLKLNFRELESFKRTGLLASMEEALRTDKVIHREVHAINTFGLDVWFEGMLSPVWIAGERHLLFSFFDIKPRKLAEEKQRRVELKLIQSQKMEAIGALAGGVAHDINNVLAVVLGLGSVLELEMGSSDPKTRDIQEIISAARRGKSLVENLLGFARKGRYEKSRILLNNTIRELVDVLSHSIPKKIAVNTILDEKLAHVECDATQVMQALLNICLNANDAIAGSGTITLSSSNDVLVAGDVEGVEPGQYVKIQIKDNGSGMDEETRQKAFEPFFTTKGIGKGTGLGLSMAFGVIENHGGVIQIDSSPGEGTAVNIWLPAAQAMVTKVTKETSEPRTTRNKHKVLLVDDEAMIRTTGQRMLEASGYDVVVADGGVAAVEIFENQAQDIDLVLLDLSMPVMDGAECFEKLKELDPNARVLICTGHASQGNTEKMIGSGAAGVVRKPFDLDQLAEAVERALPPRGAGGSGEE